MDEKGPGLFEVPSIAEINAAEKLRGQGHFSSALALTLEMLRRTPHPNVRMRLLFDFLYCSTRLNLTEVSDDAIRELDQLPEPGMSRVFIDFIQAVTYLAQGKAGSTNISTIVEAPSLGWQTSKERSTISIWPTACSPRESERRQS
jgi:hypothetical protein